MTIMRRMPLAIGALWLACASAPAGEPAWRTNPLPPEAARLNRTADNAASTETAIRLYGQSLRLYPSNGPALYGLAQTLLEQHRPADAIKVFRRMDALFPDDASIHILLAGAIARLPSPRRANIHQGLDAARRATELQPGSPEAWYVLSILLHLDGDHAQAAHAIRQALLLDADHPSNPETTALYQLQEIACTDALLVFSPLD
jgi:Flp pilus assembly protein TadD